MKIFITIILFINLLNAVTLQQLDKQRLQIKEGAMQVDIVFKSNSKKTTIKNYNILRKDKFNSLVIFMHKNERGNLIVKENNNLYIKAGRSNRAIKISPIQRLVGDVSIGDILEIRFADDYIIKKQKRNIIFLKSIDNRRTYANIKVYLTKNNRLKKAELFSYSGKLLKTVFYEFDNNSKLINKYRFKSLKGESIATIYNYKERTIPNRMFKKRNITNLYQKSKKYFNH